MALEWKIDDVQRRVTVTARGSFTSREIFEYLAALQEARALPYSKLFDVTEFTGSMTEQAIRAIGEAVARHGSLDKTLGPLALVVGNPEHLSLAEHYVSSAPVKRPVRIFRDVEEARRWLDEFDRPTEG